MWVIKSEKGYLESCYEKFLWTLEQALLVADGDCCGIDGELHHHVFTPLLRDAMTHETADDAHRSAEWIRQSMDDPHFRMQVVEVKLVEVV